DDGISVNTEDAIDVVARIDFIVASLEKAGVPPDELHHFKQVVSRLPVANNAAKDGTAVPGKEALCKRLGREAILMVSGTAAVGGTLRCVTLATKDSLALERWTNLLEQAMSQEGYLAGASIFRASQIGDILRVKELISRGVDVNRTNAYGCVALHYAVKHAADCAAVVARGGDTAGVDRSKIHAQEALRVVVFLMSHGADARAVNHLGETPLDLGFRLTSGFPKSRSLLLSILDSSKYQIAGGTIFIVPANLPSVKEEATRKEEEEEDDDDDDTVARTTGLRGAPPVATAGAAAVAATSRTTAPKTTTARGVTFSPSRRNRRAKKRYEIAKSRLPYVSSASLSSAAPSFGEGRCRSSSGGGRGGVATPALPRGDHETALGGARHRLAAGHGARCSRNDHNGGAHGGGGLGGRRGGGVARERRQAGGAGGVHFKDYRMGRSSAVLVSGGGGGGLKRGRGTTRPASCPVRGGVDEGRGPGTPGSRVANSAKGEGQQRRRRRPATTTPGGGTEMSGGSTNNGCRGDGGARVVGTRQRHGRRHSARGEQSERPGARRRREEGERAPGSMPDSEARRQIWEWLRESAGTASAVPPAMAHGSGGEILVETSSYVATGRRSDVYRALQAIKGDGRGELISAEKLRAVLCRVGQPLLPNEMDELLQETDPTGTGYVSCSRLSKLVVRGRLQPLAAGKSRTRRCSGGVPFFLTVWFSAGLRCERTR
ncbi:unnamed protein product, partial [Ectocarpus sp. 6 AP-2014]